MKTHATSPASVSKAPPLTCSGANGEAPYCRHEDVEQEIAALLTLKPDQWLGNIGASKPCNETLVHVIRQLRAVDDQARLGRILDILMRRTAKIVERWAQGLSSTQFDDVANLVTLEVIGRLLTAEPTRKSDFLEASYSVAVKRLTLKQVAKINTRREIDQPQPNISNAEGEALDPVAMVIDERPDPLELLLASNERRPTIRELLRAVIDPRHRRAFILKKIRNWPYHPGDPPGPCLCSKFNLGERQIRNWIEKAEDQMRKAYGDRT